MDNKKYNIIKTGDNTCSLFSDEYNEAMHSTSGAYEEALLKHVYPSRILKQKHNELCVLDIGFGIGYNALALLTEFLCNNPEQSLRIISLEKDSSYSPLMNELTFDDERDNIYDNIKSAFINGRYNSHLYSLEIIHGDARSSIKSLKGVSFDAVFHDPYSPSKNPELWSVEFIKEIFCLIADHGILTTYSSAPQIRTAFMEAGFRIGKGPSVGKKREGTLASRCGDIIYLVDEEISALRKDVKATPYRDRNLSDSREVILNRRIEEMRSRRSK